VYYLHTFLEAPGNCLTLLVANEKLHDASLIIANETYFA
jgi:hypothetical protein